MEPQEPPQPPRSGDVIRPADGDSPHPAEGDQFRPAATPINNSASHPLLGDAAIPALRPFGNPVDPEDSAPAEPDSASGTLPPQDIARPAPAPQPVVFAPDMPTVHHPPQPESIVQPPPSGQTPYMPFSQQPAGSFSQASPVISMSGAVSYGKPPKKPWFRRPIPIAGLVVLVLLLAGGYVFGFYIPNKPENVFKTGLSRTNIMVSRLETTATDKTKLAALKNVNFSGSLAVIGPDGTESGTFSTRYDDKTSDSTLNYNPGSGKQKFSARAMTEMAPGKDFPDIYFKLSGLSAFGLDQAAPQLMQYDGRWIGVGADYLRSLIPAGTFKQNQSQSKFSTDDAIALTKVAIDTTRDYIFTNDPAKAVLENRGFKGQEKIEGNLKADHYTVGINKQHAKDYCKAIITNVMAAPAFKDIPSVPPDNLDSERQSAITECQKSIDEGLKDSDTFDMWVGTGKKLINKVRFTDTTDKTTYIDIGQTYTSGNDLPLFLNAHSTKEKYDYKSDLTINMDSSASTGDITANFKDSDSKPWTVKVGFSLKPNKSKVTITKPKDAIPIQQVLQALGLDPNGLMDSSAMTDPALEASTGRNAAAEDTERKTDLRMLQSELEAYYAQYGSYPQLAEVNSAPWRSTNMAALDNEMLADPVGNVPTLIAMATATQYGYMPGACDASGSNCQTYMLSAVLSDGQVFTLDSLN